MSKFCGLRNEFPAPWPLHSAVFVLDKNHQGKHHRRSLGIRFLVGKYYVEAVTCQKCVCEKHLTFKYILRLKPQINKQFNSIRKCLVFF